MSIKVIVLMKSLCNGALVESMVCKACSFRIYIAAHKYTFKPTSFLQVKNMQKTSQIIKIHVDVFLKCFIPPLLKKYCGLEVT